MSRFTIIFTAALVFIHCIAPLERTALASDEAVAGLLGNRLEAAGTPATISVRGERIRITGMLQRFYENRGYLPAWSNSGKPLGQAYSLVEAASKADEEGLRPADYPMAGIAALLETVLRDLAEGSPPDTAALVDLDLMLTGTFLNYGYHLLAGRIYPEIIDGEWSDYIWEAELDRLLQKAIDTDNVEETLKRLVPPHEGYRGLRDALAQYRELAAKGGWPEVPEGPNMSKGYRGMRVGLLREVLWATGDLLFEPPAAEDLFDDALEQAVLRFQLRHGLTPDGVVGPRTLRAINVPVETRLGQLELNMERWRWLPEDLGKLHIFVNTAAFELSVMEYGQPELKMRIVAGKPYWHTPSFSARMTHLVLNPSWNVPRSIAVEDILPRLHVDPDYLASHGYNVLRGWGERMEEFDPDAIDWSGVTEENFNFRLQQGPGPLNPLGRIKFMFPNRFNVYLHDTPSKGLFEQQVRSFSHGCIRIEKPLELAEYLLPGLAREDLLGLIEEGQQLDVPLPGPVMVHSLYWTAWVEGDGTLQFRDDVYGRDEILLEILSEGPVTP
jgi:murein L,D-transpeptidase YcbB/YkuD